MFVCLRVCVCVCLYAGAYACLYHVMVHNTFIEHNWFNGFVIYTKHLELAQYDPTELSSEIHVSASGDVDHVITFTGMIFWITVPR